MYQRVDLFVSHAPVFYDFGISAIVQSKKPDFGLSGLFLFSSKKSSLVAALCCVEPGFSPAQDDFSTIADQLSAQRCLADLAVVFFRDRKFWDTPGFYLPCFCSMCVCHCGNGCFPCRVPCSIWHWAQGSYCICFPSKRNVWR